MFQPAADTQQATAAQDPVVTTVDVDDPRSYQAKKKAALERRAKENIEHPKFLQWKRLHFPLRPTKPLQDVDELIAERDLAFERQEEPERGVASVVQVFRAQGLLKKEEGVSNKAPPYHPYQQYDEFKLQKRQELQSWDPRRDPNIVGALECTVIVARLNTQTTEQQLTQFCSRFGGVKSVRIVRGKETKSGVENDDGDEDSGSEGSSGSSSSDSSSSSDTEEETNNNTTAKAGGVGRSKGYAFVEYNRPEEARRAKAEGNDKYFKGKKVVIDMRKGTGPSGKFRPFRLRNYGDIKMPVNPGAFGRQKRGRE